MFIVHDNVDLFSIIVFYHIFDSHFCLDIFHLFIVFDMFMVHDNVDLFSIIVFHHIFDVLFNI